ncbi:hypothetical protein AK812_SmicGene28740 [Symbiodinium microadriaticum]|uniref:Uncharacterized protein n=1 Tax=Symbiodinium microadriaticum TaxID=2951 RepID=A0A1Q9D3P4_SYMMI|nr:hypothetical protein AK812_SmicGene28740 [Symbiodinium microadriaticum]CAE7341995.1 unnamed protein product [Symbiodinium sp. KB8]
MGTPGIFIEVELGLFGSPVLLHSSSTQVPAPPREWWATGKPLLFAPLGLALAPMAKFTRSTRTSRLQARAAKKEGSEPALSKRKRNDPQDITLLDMGTGFTVGEDLGRLSRITVKNGRERVKERWVVRNTDEKEDETRDPKELISEVAAEVNGMDEAFLSDLVGMTSVERADMIDELTRKAFMLMEAGEISEAKEHLQRATRIGEAFERLSQELEVVQEKKGRAKTETEVVMELRRELHQEDFSKIFGAHARFARFIGGM